MFSKLKLICWHLINIKYSPQLFILFLHYLTKRKTKPNSKLKKWILEHNTSLSEFFEKLNFQKIDFYSEHKEEIMHGYQIEKNNTIKLGGGGHLDLIHNLVHYLNPKFVLETGVAYGWSSLAILTAFNKNDNSKLISIDMKYPLLQDYSKIRGAVVLNKVNWTFIDAIDLYGINLADKYRENQKYDFIHYDSDKTYIGRSLSYPRLWKRLNKDGYFLSDDIADNMAFYDFCKKLNLKPAIFAINNRYAGLIKKEI